MKREDLQVGTILEFNKNFIPSQNWNQSYDGWVQNEKYKYAKILHINKQYGLFFSNNSIEFNDESLNVGRYDFNWISSRYSVFKTEHLIVFQEKINRLELVE